VAAPLIIGYSFLLGMLHGILPDEHTWPSHSATPSGCERQAGMRAGLFFSAAFTVQRALLAQVSYFASLRCCQAGCQRDRSSA